jgi:hypothetical protein
MEFERGKTKKVRLELIIQTTINLTTTMFELDTNTDTNNMIVASAAKTAWKNDMEGWRRLIEEATSEELKLTYKTLLRRS